MLKLFKNCAAALLTGLLLGTISPAQAAIMPENTAQLITANPAVSRTIIWQTTQAGQHHYVEYKQKNSRYIKTVPADTAAVPNFDESPQKFRHSAYLNNLTPGKHYLYRTISDNRASAWHSLTAPAADKFKAIIFGDSQSVNYAVWGNTAQSAWQRNPDADFFINMGDLVDNGQHAWQWNEWFKYAKPLITDIPLAPVSGNHENYSINWQFAPADVYNTLFPLPSNGAAGLKNQSYSFDAGAVHFVVLDSQLEELKAFQPDLFTRQQQWLQEDLAASRQLWKIVLMHRNPISYEGKDELTETGKAFMPLFEKYNVDIVFTAHIHAYGRTMPLKNNKPAKDGVIYISTGRSGDDAWPVPRQKRSELIFDAQINQTNYLTLTQSDHTLTIQNFQLDGSLHDEISLTK